PAVRVGSVELRRHGLVRPGEDHAGDGQERLRRDQQRGRAFGLAGRATWLQDTEGPGSGALRFYGDGAVTVSVKEQRPPPTVYVYVPDVSSRRGRPRSGRLSLRRSTGGRFEPRPGDRSPLDRAYTHPFRSAGTRLPGVLKELVGLS